MMREPHLAGLAFLSNSEGNFIDLRSLSSLSENLRSWSADVPLKKPKSLSR